MQLLQFCLTGFAPGGPEADNQRLLPAELGKEDFFTLQVLERRIEVLTPRTAGRTSQKDKEKYRKQSEKSMSFSGAGAIFFILHLQFHLIRVNFLVNNCRPVFN